MSGTYSPTGLALTKKFEGLSLAAYQDVAGVWTIGYGHTGDVYGTPIHEGLTITEATAEGLLLGDLRAAVLWVNKLVTVPLTQGLFDALVDFCYNCGRGNFRASTLLHMVNAGDFAGAAEQFGLWVHADGKVVPGLLARRAEEAAMFRA